MTFEERLRAILGEQVWTTATLMQRLEDAQKRIAELEAAAKLAEAPKDE